MSVCVECCVLSGRGLCDGLITYPEKPYRPLCVVVCDLETSRMRRPWPALGRSATVGTRIINMILKNFSSLKTMKIYNVLALLTLLYGCETWKIREQYKSRMT